MWPFSPKQKLSSPALFQGATDWHAHILPGVDDGVQTIEESLEVLTLYEQLGVQTVWLTPHIMEDIPNTPALLTERFNTLTQAYRGNIQLRLAAENMLDNLFCQRLEQNDLLPLGENGDCLLVETSYFNPPADFHDLLRRIKAKGYNPVLAHPERYQYMEPDDYAALRDLQVRLQLNVGSLTGLYGKDVLKKAQYLLKNGYYTYAGSDLHSRHCLTNSLERVISKPDAEKLRALMR